MAYDYSEDLAFAVETINEYGRPVSFYKEAKDVDAANPLGAPEDPTPSAPVKAVFVYPSGVQNLGSFGFLASTFKDFEQVAMIAPSAAVGDYYDQTHLIDFDGSTWAIGKVDKFQPGDTALLYYVGVNRP